MADVFAVANFFIDVVNSSEDDQITNLKLNKLLYFAQGTYLARTGKPLFEESIEAWDLGPVVPAVYRRYKVCGREPIEGTDDEYDSSVFTADELDTLLDTMREYGQYTGSKLVTLTHVDGAPWDQTRENGATIIDMSMLKRYFEAHPVPYLSEKIEIPKVKKLPAEWYDPSEDAEWEAYL